MFKLDKQNRLKASVLAIALAVLPLGAYAAGLGRLTVLSPLGQPLRAELELTASREELSSLTAKVATADAFKQAGIDYMPVLSTIRISVEKRSNGQPYLRVQTDRAVNDPFVDLLVEVTWSSGRLVREYTFLLDPPEALRVAPAVPTTSPVAAPAAMPAAETKPEPALPAGEVTPARKPVAAEAKPAIKESKPAAGSREVKRGDTLTKIALETKAEGVSLDQMLVALFRGNQEAFVGANMNRLKAGKILNIPEAEAVAGVGGRAAHKIVVAQAADFNAYRRKLAAAVTAAEPAKEELPKQAAAGKITPKVEEKAPAPATGKDKLAVSRTEAAKDSKAAGRITTLEEDIVARDKALKEASSRIADLEKNLGDLKKLAELKSQSGVQLQQQAEAGKAAPEAKKPEPAPAAPVQAEAKAPEKPVEVAKPAETATTPAEAEKPAEVAKAAETPAPTPAPEVAIPPAPAAKKAIPAPPPQPEPPSFVEENGLLVFGGSALLLAVAGYFGYSAWRRKRQGADMGTTSRISGGDLTANSVFGSTGGQSVDTSGNVSLQTDFSQSGMSAINTDEGVDPVAEADVYMAYGRDAQAEEILLDALKTDPTRHAIHLKLLEIYVARKSIKQFETLAMELYGQTGGAGPDWEKVAALGRALDPANPIYGAGKSAAAPSMAELAATTIVVSPSTQKEKLSDTVTMPGQLAQIAAAAAAAPAAAEPSSLDFDLNIGGAASTAAPSTASAHAPAEVTSLDFDLDLGGSAEVVTPAVPKASQVDVELGLPPTAPKADAGIDFDLDLGSPATPTASQVVVAKLEAAPPVSFDFDLGSLSAPPPAAEPALDLSSISLDLGSPAVAPTPAAREVSSEGGDETATKLELALAYEEMGDKEGARELLQEVVSEGSPAQQKTARQKLATLET